MAYKTILTVLTGLGQTAQLDAAIAVAEAEDAHLDVFCLSVDHSQTGYFYAGASAYVFQESIDRALQAAAACEAQARTRLEGKPIRWAADSAVAQLGGISAIVGMRARFADLMVQARPYGKDAPSDAEAVTEAAMFEGGCPVLVLPETGLPAGFDKRIMVAWNQSNEALAAIRRAMPWLVRAEAVDIAVVDPPPSAADRSDPGGMLCHMLNRHGAPASVAVLARTMPRVSDTLNRRVRETGATMIVMGAYGRSRFREAILGGTTRGMLEQAIVPVLIAR